MSWGFERRGSVSGAGRRVGRADRESAVPQGARYKTQEHGSRPVDVAWGKSTRGMAANKRQGRAAEREGKLRTNEGAGGREGVPA